MEYWGELALRRLLSLMEKFAMVDDCTVKRKRIGFARVCMKVDFSQPLRPNMRILGLEGPFWRRFISENLDYLYLYFGRLHLPREMCPTSRGGVAMAKGEGALADGEALEDVVGSPWGCG